LITEKRQRRRYAARPSPGLTARLMLDDGIGTGHDQRFVAVVVAHKVHTLAGTRLANLDYLTLVFTLTDDPSADTEPVAHVCLHEDPLRVTNVSSLPSSRTR
jgi:hypothetical protein